MQWVITSDAEDWRRIRALVEAALNAPQADAGALRQLCKHLAQDQRWREDARAILTRAVARLPDDAHLRAYLAKVLIQLRDYSTARQQVDAALRIAPSLQMARSQHFHLLMQANKRDEARAMIDEIAANNPMNKTLFKLMMEAAPTEAECERLLAVNQAALADNPALSEPRYRQAIVLARLGRAEEARTVLDIARHTEIRDLGAPEGFGDPDSFRAGLAAEIQRNPFLMEDVLATRGGRQTLLLDQPDALHMAALLKQIMAAVEAYEDRLTPEADSFYTARPRRARLSSWAVIYGPEGRQLPHMHPSGWVSGVYYVSAPRADGETAYRGPMVLGEAPSRYRLDPPPWGVREIEPAPGRIVLFPSFVPHATRPTHIDGDRICVAFDVIPAG